MLQRAPVRVCVWTGTSAQRRSCPLLRCCQSTALSSIDRRIRSFTLTPRVRTSSLLAVTIWCYWMSTARLSLVF